jgi:hypothetical protein
LSILENIAVLRTLIEMALDLRVLRGSEQKRPRKGKKGRVT